MRDLTSTIESRATVRFSVQDYDLAATLNCGQAFRWKQNGRYWEGVIGSRWVQLCRAGFQPAGEGGIHLRQGYGGQVLPPGQTAGQDARLTGRLEAYPTSFEIVAETAEPVENWDWLTRYLQLDVDLISVLAAFPQDEPMRQAIASCRGLRLLRQDPWECLGSFILSSTKQIVQIQQIITLLCQRFGDALQVLPGQSPAFSFPSPARLAECSESELRDCKMGFRAPYLLATAKLVSSGDIALAELQRMPVDEARDELMKLPGVGRKIADCVLLFAYGFQSAFPVDVWVMKGLRELYFGRRRVKLPRLQRFSRTHFGPYSGYAQQYLFHYMRTRPKPAELTRDKS